MRVNPQTLPPYLNERRNYANTFNPPDWLKYLAPKSYNYPKLNRRNQERRNEKRRLPDRRQYEPLKQSSNDAFSLTLAEIKLIEDIYMSNL
jgi:hypothetical protein